MTDRGLQVLPPKFKLNELARKYLEEDVPSFDIGGYVVGTKLSQANIYFKSVGIVAGIPFAQAVFDIAGCSVQWFYEEGTLLSPDIAAKEKIVLGSVTGRACDLLLAERTVLNIMSRASGVATQSRKMKEISDAHHWTGSVAGTRKVTPGFRLIEKYALIVGGAAPHRHDLSQMIMLKDNHINLTGSITNAVRKAKEAAGFSVKIEVECQNREEAVEAAMAGADIVMLDNYSAVRMAEDSGLLKGQFPHLLVEASGGITAATIGSYMLPSVDIISQGCLTQGYSCMDISMKIDTKEGVSGV
jgi:nicotinate-nucleotide pyrophosphorylase (carboxylating)